jgi:hypothetical protein
MLVIAATAVMLGEGAFGQADVSNRTVASDSQRETEVLLRKHIDGMRIGKPIYEAMTTNVANAVRGYEQVGKERLEKLGAIRSVEFRGDGSEGTDVYFVQYEHGASEYLIRLASDGKINALVVRATP